MKKLELIDYNDQIEDWSIYEPLTLKEAIIYKCHECCCYQPEEVKLSPCKSCPLFLFKEKYYRAPQKKKRSKRQLTEEQRKAIGERLLKGRKKIGEN